VVTAEDAQELIILAMKNAYHSTTGMP